MAYTVWGGYPDQDGDHWGTFRTLVDAEEYRRQQLQLQEDPRLVLHIKEERNATGPWCIDCGIEVSGAEGHYSEIQCSFCQEAESGN